MFLSRSVDYKTALSLIFSNAIEIGTEILPLSKSLGRILRNNAEAQLPDPPYDQSLRDGFAVSQISPESDGTAVYRLIGEIAAGEYGNFVLKAAGDACRIMTGALIPEGCAAVIPQEICRVEGQCLIVQAEALKRAGRFTQKKGSVIKTGSVIACAGTRLCAKNIALLSATGSHEIEVYRKAKVAFLCSGSELVEIGDKCRSGQKVSSNRYLLDCLIQEQGAISVDHGIVHDDPDQLADVFAGIAEGDSDVIISTGGLGPGKYDLLEAAFEKKGGEIIYRSLNVRPGKSTIFGMLGNKLYFGLPGPPTAVHVLYKEFIIPVLRKIQGLNLFENKGVTAELGHDIAIGGIDVLHIKEGVVSFSEKGIIVRLAEKLEAGNCLIVLPEGITKFWKGESVTVHLDRDIGSL